MAITAITEAIKTLKEAEQRLKLARTDEVIFIKLTQGEQVKYDVSKVFSPFISDRELDRLVQILRSIGQIIK